MSTKAPKECLGCGKLISYSYFSAHQKSCQAFLALPSPKELVESYKDTDKLRKRVEELEAELLKANTAIENFRSNVYNNCTIDQSNTNNTNLNIEMTNNYYVINCNTGEKDGLDMKKINSFGYENVDYIEKNKSLEFTLNKIYCNEDHPENRIISHAYLNNEWLLIKLTNERVLRYHINEDTMHIFRDTIINNVERICETKWGVEEKNRAIKGLISNLSKEVETGKYKHLPIWNNRQYNKTDNNEWLTHYVKQPNFLQKMMEPEKGITCN